MERPQGNAGRIGLRNRHQNEVPRGILFLHNETRRRDINNRLWFALAGGRRTGKSTLATRFGVLYRDELMENEVVVRNSYRFTVDLNMRSAVNRNGIVNVGVFIDPLPFPPGGLDVIYQIAHLRAIIFLFDVNKDTTLARAWTMFDNYKRHHDENMHPSILVGNKIDIRDDPRNDPHDLPPGTMPPIYGASIARFIGALGYYECSALKNIGIGPILDKILQLILR